MTEIPLRAYIDQRFHDLDEKIQTRFDSEERERVVLRHNMEERLEGMNQMRAQLDGQARDFSEWRAQMQGRMYMIALLPVAVSIVVGGIAIWTALTQTGG